MRGEIYPRDDNDAFLHPKEVASRFACVVPRILIDWRRADDRLQKKLEELIEQGTPDPILAGHRNLLGNTFFFRAEFPDLSNLAVVGWV